MSSGVLEVPFFEAALHSPAASVSSQARAKGFGKDDM